MAEASTYNHEEIATSMRLGTWTVGIIQLMVKQLLREVKEANAERNAAYDEISRLRMVVKGLPELIDEIDDANIGHLRATIVGIKAIAIAALDKAHGSFTGKGEP